MHPLITTARLRPSLRYCPMKGSEGDDHHPASLTPGDMGALDFSGDGAVVGYSRRRYQRLRIRTTPA